MSKVKNIIATRASFNAICAQNGATELLINIGLIGSERFTSAQRERVLPASANTVQSMKIPQIVSEMIADIEKIGFSINGYRVADSQTEPTLVLFVTHKNAKITYHDLNVIASRYAQDCIAVCNKDFEGILLGEYNTIWGEFSLDYFIK